MGLQQWEAWRKPWTGLPSTAHRWASALLTLHTNYLLVAREANFQETNQEMSIFLHQHLIPYRTSTWHACPRCDVCNVQVYCGNQAHFCDRMTDLDDILASCWPPQVSPPQETHVFFLVGSTWASKDHRLGNNTGMTYWFLFSVEGKPLVVTRQCGPVLHLLMDTEFQVEIKAPAQAM